MFNLNLSKEVIREKIEIPNYSAWNLDGKTSISFVIIHFGSIWLFDDITACFDELALFDSIFFNSFDFHLFLN